MSDLYIVATPIGNLQDITFRALDILKSVDCILSEDTRVTKKLLENFEISSKLLPFHQHSDFRQFEKVKDLLEKGKNLALVSDAGTPGISDPGGKLVEYIAGNCPSVKIVPIPGASASVAALSISGFPADKFVFMGFPPHKKGREKFFKELAEAKYTVVFYESRYRILKTLEALKEIRGKIVVCRELTKMFESIYRGSAEEISGQLKKDKIKGEFVVVVGKKLN